MRSDGDEVSDAADDGQAPIQAIVNAADAVEYISKTTQGVGVRELAAVRGHEGTIVAAVSLSGPKFRLADGRLPDIAQRVTAAAAAISRHRGYVPRALPKTAARGLRSLEA